MGLLDKLVNYLGLKKKEVKILVVGLNNSGKSTVVNNLKLDENKANEIVPTLGLNVDKFKRKYNV